MKTLIAEDDEASRIVLSRYLSRYSSCDEVVDGLEAVEAFKAACRKNEPYNLICLDLMMPRMDGITALKKIRDIESEYYNNPEQRSKIVIITALSETPFMQSSFDKGCDAYATKPVDFERFMDVLKEIGCDLN